MQLLNSLYIPANFSTKTRIVIIVPYRAQTAMSEQTALIEEGSKSSRRKFLIGITGAFGLAFTSVTGIACIQLMDQIPPDFELTVFRFIIGFIFTTIYLSAKQKLPRLEKCNIKWMIAVSLCSLSYNVFVYNHFLKSITFLGIQSIQTSMNIVFSVILSKIFLKVKISFAKGLSAVSVLGGLVVILAAQYVEETSCLKTAENRNISSVTKEMEIPMHYTTKNRTILDKATELEDSVEEIPSMDNTTIGFNTSLSNPMGRKGKLYSINLNYHCNSFPIPGCPRFLFEFAGCFRNNP